MINFLKRLQKQSKPEKNDKYYNRKLFSGQAYGTLGNSDAVTSAGTVSLNYDTGVVTGSGTAFGMEFQQLEMSFVLVIVVQQLEML